MYPISTPFESCVVSDGNQTIKWTAKPSSWFESCVVSDGNQTINVAWLTKRQFESCVVSDGNQTPQCYTTFSGLV